MASFFEQVWYLVAKIPCGKVATYGQIAYLLGNPRAARTVGWALHGIPDDLDIPWHRVINSKGRISMDCGEHDPDLQRLLLEGEGVEFVNDRIDLVRYQWRPVDENLNLSPLDEKEPQDAV
ncbi:MGMT family protein [candidate division KSB1 bacterium]|nr:MGMT family protein [candidate division KSB1 bacterium]